MIQRGLSMSNSTVKFWGSVTILHQNQAQVQSGEDHDFRPHNFTELFIIIFNMGI